MWPSLFCPPCPGLRRPEEVTFGTLPTLCGQQEPRLRTTLRRGGAGQGLGWTFLLVNGDSLGISGVGLPLSQAWLTPQTHGHRSGTRGAPGAPQAVQNKKCLKGVCVQFLLRLGSEFVGGGGAGMWGSTLWPQPRGVGGCCAPCLGGPALILWQTPLLEFHMNSSH